VECSGLVGGHETAALSDRSAQVRAMLGDAFAMQNNAVTQQKNKPLAISKFMTPSPHSIGVEQSLSVAHAMMREHHVRHLPVLHGGKLVGLLTERDARLVESLKDVDAQQVTVEDAMSQSVYVVAPDAPLSSVAREMAEHKYGSAVVMEKGKVVGIFTTVDACSALASLLH
jgi:acetoin utilization protein AcuB